MSNSQTDRESDVLAMVRARLSSEKRLGDRFQADRLELDADGVLVFEAEVDEVAQKKIALETAAATPGVTGIADRVRVKPASRMGDAEIRSHLRIAFGRDPALAGLKIEEVSGGKRDMVAAPADLHGSIDYEVIDGIITLNGFVPGLMTKRYAGVLAWWIPGSRDVINGIAVTSDEADGADKIAEAVDLVIEKNPYLNAAQVKVGVRNRTVRLTGFLPSEEQKRMAENDAWCVFGVDDVVNEIEVGG